MLQKKPVILSFFPTSNHPFLKSTTLAINQAEPSQEVPQVSTSITRDLNRCDPYEHKLTQNRLHIWLCRSSRSKLSAQRMARLQPLAGAPNWRWQYDVIRWCNMMMMRSRGTMFFFFFFFFCLWSWWFACWYQWWEVRHALLKYRSQSESCLGKRVAGHLVAWSKVRWPWRPPRWRRCMIWGCLAGLRERCLLRKPLDACR